MLGALEGAVFGDHHELIEAFELVEGLDFIGFWAVEIKGNSFAFIEELISFFSLCQPSEDLKAQEVELFILSG